jgi:hypothetical protein
MKFALFIFVSMFMICNNSFSQVNGKGVVFYALDPSNSGKIFHNSIPLKTKPEGSPYVISQFMPAKVEHVEKPSKMRYNAFSDEFEFITEKKDTLILDKKTDFSIITFVSTKTRYQLVTYSKSKKSYTGYLISLTQLENINLFKKENIGLTEEKIAKTTLEMSMPPRYFKDENDYYLSLKNHNIIEFPTNKKRLFKEFPDKKEHIEIYIKQNNIDFDIENDLIKITEFLDKLFKGSSIN